jgi:energy-coupling factor transport system permease protein
VRVATGLGQYVPVASPVHALNARAKMALVAGLTIALFSVDGFEGLAVLAATVAATVGLSRVPWRVALRGLRMIALLLAFTSGGERTSSRRSDRSGSPAQGS